MGSRWEIPIWTVIGVAFGSVSVYLAVRIVNRRERYPRRIFAGALCVLLIYPASMGPAAWLYARLGKPSWAFRCIQIAYQPIIAAEQRGPASINDAMVCYRGWWMR